eukprot:Platyproteum_vivax@DN4880_c0_g1_i1.p1
MSHLQQLRTFPGGTPSQTWTWAKFCGFLGTAPLDDLLKIEPLFDKCNTRADMLQEVDILRNHVDNMQRNTQFLKEASLIRGNARLVETTEGLEQAERSLKCTVDSLQHLHKSETLLKRMTEGEILAENQLLLKQVNFLGRKQKDMEGRLSQMRTHNGALLAFKSSMETTVSSLKVLNKSLNDSKNGLKDSVKHYSKENIALSTKKQGLEQALSSLRLQNEVLQSHNLDLAVEVHKLTQTKTDLGAALEIVQKREKALTASVRRVSGVAVAEEYSTGEEPSSPELVALEMAKQALEDTVEALTNELHEMRHEMQNERSQQVASTKEIKEELSKALSRNESLKVEHVESADGVVQQLDEVLNQNEMLKLEQAELKESVANLTAQNSDLQDEVATLLSISLKVDQLESDRHELDSHMQNLKSDNDKLREELAFIVADKPTSASEFEGLILTLKQDNENLKKEIEGSPDAVVAGKISQFLINSSELEKTIVVLKQDNENLKIELDSVKQEDRNIEIAGVLEEKNLELEGVVSDLRSDKDALKKTLEGISEQSPVDAKVTFLEQKNANLESAIASLQNDNQNLKRAIEEGPQSRSMEQLFTAAESSLVTETIEELIQETEINVQRDLDTRTILLEESIVE